MRYQLVIQCPASSISDYDAMIGFEEELSKAAAPDDLDGHDFGSGEMNIFFFTETPEALFERLRPLLKSQDRLASVRVAFRDVSKDEYEVLWPPDLQRFEIS
jgi:hypothetical protein